MNFAYVVYVGSQLTLLSLILPRDMRDLRPLCVFITTLDNVFLSRATIGR